MTTPHTYGVVQDIDAAKQLLADLVAQAFEQVVKRDDHHRAIRLEVPIEPVDQLAWLRLQGNRSRGYWADRDGSFKIAGRGTADVITAETETDYDDLIETLRASIAGVHPNLRYYGGMRFSYSSAVDPQWKPFRAYRFVLPRFELVNRGAQTYLACNAVLHPDEDPWILRDELLSELEAMPFPNDNGYVAPSAVVARHDSPNHDEWTTLINRAVNAIRSGEFEKVVLARKTTFSFEDNLDALSLLVPLIETSPRAYHFCFQPRPDFAFMGAAPERIYRRQGRFIESEAVAGTRPRGANDAEDKKLGQDLMHSDKDRREHAYVVNTIRHELEARCKALHEDNTPSLLKLRRVQHLYTAFEGILREAAGIDASLLHSLQPTPAVGGYPRNPAIRFIDKHEPFDRGWYAGAIGWVSHDAAEFAVGIRSGVVDGNTLSLYSGAGIVEGSTPGEEWAEIEQKMSNFLSVITGE